MITATPATKPLTDRIYNWKFNSALSELKALPAGTVGPEDTALIGSLAELVGDSGWVSGNIGTLIGCAISQLLGHAE